MQQQNLVGMIVSLLLTGIMIVTYIMVLIALWRGMKAHEKIAKALSEIAEKTIQK